MSNYYWIEIDGVRYYTNGDVCKDIEIIPTAKNKKVVKLIYALNTFDRTKNRMFPDVEELIIGHNVVKIDMPNTMFPNVHQVTSVSTSFYTHKYIIERQHKRLLNAFAQSEDKPLYLDDLCEIAPMALEGCKCKETVCTKDNHQITANTNAFTGSAFMDLPFVNGIKKAGRLIVDIDSNADEVVLPKGQICNFPPITAKCIRIQNLQHLQYIETMPRKIILDADNISENKNMNIDSLYINLSKTGLECIESRMEQYKSCDGILYSGDRKTLIVCPQEKTGAVIIPEGTTRIRKRAFATSKISSVIFPDSMRALEDDTFYSCQSLKSVDFGNGIEHIGENGRQYMFANCNKLKELYFPPQIKVIGIGAFRFCSGLQKITFSEGLETICNSAFTDCNSLTYIKFPKSLDSIGKMAFVNTSDYVKNPEDVEVHLQSVPYNLAYAFIYPGVTRLYRCIDMYVDLGYDYFHFVLPNAVRPYDFSLINHDCNRIDTRCTVAQKLLDTAYDKACTSSLAAITGFKAYLKTKNKAAKEFVQNEWYRIAREIINHASEEELVALLKLDFLEIQYDENLAEQLRQKNWIIGLAYFLERTKKEENFSL